MHPHINKYLLNDINRDGIYVINWTQQDKEHFWADWHDTKGLLLTERPEIPWSDVIGIRNHIAHGYFDINGYLVFDTIKNNLDTLQEAIKYFLQTL
jgi:hypothetical protein